MVVTGPQGRPAASHEEDLLLTIEIIKGHWKDQFLLKDEKLLLEEEEEEQQKEVSLQKETPTEAPTPTVAESFDTIRQVLSQDYSDALKRIACAFAPSADKLRPKHVESVSVVSLNSTRMEISALVGEGGACVNVLVPVSFPESTRDDLASVIQTLEQLDTTALERIALSEWKEDNYETIHRQDRLTRQLEEEPHPANLPSWWTKPLAREFDMMDECDNVKKLLNEADFAPEVLMLAKEQVAVVNNGAVDVDQLKVTQAAVALVGTTGLFMRAHVELLGTEKEMVVDLPMKFRSAQDAPMATVKDLRSAVLALVDSVTVEAS